jgi:hypothetical protein
MAGAGEAYCGPRRWVSMALNGLGWSTESLDSTRAISGAGAAPAGAPSFPWAAWPAPMPKEKVGDSVRED